MDYLSCADVVSDESNVKKKPLPIGGSILRL